MKVERFPGDVMHNYDAESKACLNRQILNNSVKKKAMEDFCEIMRKLIHIELQSQYVRLYSHL
jgi:hypothetical protein